MPPKKKKDLESEASTTEPKFNQEPNNPGHNWIWNKNSTLIYGFT